MAQSEFGKLRLEELVRVHGEHECASMIERFLRDQDYRKDANKKWRMGQREKVRAYDALLREKGHQVQ